MQKTTDSYSVCFPRWVLTAPPKLAVATWFSSTYWASVYRGIAGTFCTDTKLQPVRELGLIPTPGSAQMERTEEFAQCERFVWDRPASRHWVSSKLNKGKREWKGEAPKQGQTFLIRSRDNCEVCPKEKEVITYQIFSYLNDCPFSKWKVYCCSWFNIRAFSV